MVRAGLKVSQFTTFLTTLLIRATEHPSKRAGTTTYLTGDRRTARGWIGEGAHCNSFFLQSSNLCDVSVRHDGRNDCIGPRYRTRIRKILLAIETKARAVVGGKKSLLCDPGSKSRKGGSWRSRVNIVD